MAASHLGDLFRMELGRKAFGNMRWAKVWDAALRIRSAFTGAAVPDAIISDLASVLEEFPMQNCWAIRSTAPGEESSQRSFAGLHESYLRVTGLPAIMDAVRLVWASLWSDAAMLYRRELALALPPPALANSLRSTYASGPPA